MSATHRHVALAYREGPKLSPSAYLAARTRGWRGLRFPSVVEGFVAARTSALRAAEAHVEGQEALDHA